MNRRYGKKVLFIKVMCGSKFIEINGKEEKLRVVNNGN
jgi:hypothetical protein